ncbi:MAG TPA: TIGR04282 family arsenosugar biosynthesis glycosyltransferase [Pyrinomonadaceae bacterium]|nr:TIGR04282 family arsenosugar biosynthesis glycosyltransferase [Pyrinomonadaceae bacterium]
MPRPIVVLMAKAPRAGHVKTRLVPPLTQSQAAALADCFIRDTVLNVRQIVDTLMIAYAPANARQDLEPILPSNLLWFEQRGDDLGERLDSVANHLSFLGFGPVVILGADSPTLPATFIEQALEVLASGQADVTLGPTTDGGYYLVGMNSAIAGLFRNIDWSTPFAYEQTVANANALDLRLHTLPMWYDVDTPADLYLLREQMSADDPTLMKRAPNTYRWFSANALPPS